MARANAFLSVTADTAHITEGAANAGSTCPIPCFRSAESFTSPWIWLPSTVDRSSTAAQSSSRPRTNSLYLHQGFSHDAPFAYHSTGHGMDAADHHRPDLLTKTHNQCGFELLIEHKGKEAAIWLVVIVGAPDLLRLQLEPLRRHLKKESKPINAEAYKP